MLLVSEGSLEWRLWKEGSDGQREGRPEAIGWVWKERLVCCEIGHTWPIDFAKPTTSETALLQLGQIPPTTQDTHNANQAKLT